MKAIKQLAVHFWGRGMISPPEAAYLVRHGFVREHDLPGFAYRPEVLAPPEVSLPPEPPSPWTAVEERLERSAPRRRKACVSEMLDAQDLCRLLEAEFSHRARHYRVLVTLARGAGLAGCETWPAAAAALRNVTDDSLRRGRDEAKRRGATRRQIDAAVDLTPFCDLAARAGSGPATQAFRALLTDPNPAAVGKYVWILRHAPARTVRNLVILATRLSRLDRAE